MLTLLSTFFIISLTWHVSYPSNVLVFGLMTLIFLFYMKNPFPLYDKTINLLLCTILVIIFFLLINMTMYEDFSYLKINSYIKKMSFAIIIFTFVLFFYKDQVKLLIKSIEYALFFIVSLWYMQLIMYYVSGHYIDLLEPLIGQPQRYQAYFMSSVDFIIRPTSLFTEPGTYAVNTFPLLSIIYIYYRKITKIQILTLISYFASFSLFAIIIATLYIIVIEFSSFKFELSKKNVIMFFLLAIVLMGLERYLYFRFVLEHNVGAVGLREHIINYWLSLDSKGILLGQGNAQTRFLNYTVDDTSFLFKLIYEYGIFSIPFFIMLVYFYWGMPLVFLLIMFITKLTYLLYVFWFYLASVHIIQISKRKSNYGQ
ncbi:hypothetical protein [Hydrogenimonas sp.]